MSMLYITGSLQFFMVAEINLHSFVWQGELGGATAGEEWSSGFRCTGREGWVL